MKSLHKIILFALLPLMGACSGMLDIEPHSAVSPTVVGSDDIEALRIGMYNKVQEGPTYYSYIAFDLFGGELMTSTGRPIDLINSLSNALHTFVSSQWNGYYKALLQVNNVMSIAEGLADSPTRNRVLGECRTMPTNFTRDVIMKAPSHDIMNSMARSVLTLASYDPKAGDLEISNVLRQSIQLAGIFPMLAVYSYHAYNHYEKDGSMYIHRPDPELSTAENFLRMLRPDMKYTELEARVLDVALLLHAEHGGGNNSTFTTRVVTSSGTDTYSAMAAALCSLKGPRHGGANLMVMQMMQNIRENLHDTEDDEELEAYLKKLLHGEAFDRKGLIYGMGHAVYSLSDPREVVFKGYVEQLAHEKGRDKDLALYNKIEHMAPQLIAEERKIFKGVSPNVDFYSGFVYDMLGIPMELYTPLFAVARVMGWSAHRIEELLSANKIIRPAYKSLGGTHEYIRRNERE